MIVMIGSLRAGLVSMVPNLVPILLTLGMMAVTDIPIDMFTLLAGCIAIGLAVDDSIHFISSFRRYLGMGHDPIRAVEETMQSTGRALLFTSIVLTAGFLVLMLSDMNNLQQVGALTAFAITSAFLIWARDSDLARCRHLCGDNAPPATCFRPGVLSKSLR